MRPASIKPCARCRGAVRPHNAKGDCLVCRAAARLARRRVKAASLGTPLVRYGSVLKVADDLHSVWTRARWVACVVCWRRFEPEEMQCMHGFSRKCHATRFSEFNTFAGDPGCHMKHTPPGPDWYDWLRGYVGEAHYARLLAAKKLTWRHSLSDLQLVIIQTRSRIAALPTGDRKDWALDREAAITSRLVSVGRAA